MKKILILAVIFMATLTFAATTTNTFSKTQTFSGISVSNATDGIEITYAALYSPTNIFVVVTSGEVFLAPSMQEQVVRAGNSSSSVTVWTYQAVDNGLRMPVIDSGKFYVKTTNVANNVITVTLE